MTENFTIEALAGLDPAALPSCDATAGRSALETSRGVWTVARCVRAVTD